MMRGLLRCGILFLGSAMALAYAEPGSVATVTDPPVPASHPTARLLVSLKAGIDGEIFPFFANYASLRAPEQRKWGIIAVTLTNPAQTPFDAEVAADVPGWSESEIQTAILNPGETKTLLFAPPFLPRFYANHEIGAAIAKVKVSDASGGAFSSVRTMPVRIRSAQDIYWGTKFEYAPFIASWITPHEPEVERILSEAKELMPGRRLPGYDPNKPELQERTTTDQARAIYEALQHAGISYVKSSMTFGDHQSTSERVRMPRQSLRDVSANCIDGAVLYASLFENLGMDSVILLVPGHAYVGVRVAPNSRKFLYIETAIIGRASFDESIAAAQRGVESFKGQEIATIDVSKTRSQGIYPMPEDSTVEENPAARQLGASASHLRGE